MPAGVDGSGREEPPEVAKAAAPEQGVADGVEGDVAVRVAVEPRRAGDDDPAERERLAWAERMLVVTDPARAACAVPASSASARRGRQAGSP